MLRILGRCETKATKLDVNAPKFSRKGRAPTRIAEFFGGKAAPEYVNDVFFTISQNIFLILSLDWIINAIED